MIRVLLGFWLVTQLVGPASTAAQVESPEPPPWKSRQRATALYYGKIIECDDATRTLKLQIEPTQRVAAFDWRELVDDKFRRIGAPAAIGKTAVVHVHDETLQTLGVAESDQRRASVRVNLPTDILPQLKPLAAHLQTTVGQEEAEWFFADVMIKRNGVGNKGVVVGRLPLPAGVDLKDVKSQAIVYPQGFFVAELTELRPSLEFIVPGHLRAKIVPAGKQWLDNVKTVALTKAAPGQLVNTTLKLRFENETDVSPQMAQWSPSFESAYPNFAEQLKKLTPNASGTYDITGESPGKYLVRIYRGQGFDSAEVEVSLGPDTPQQLEVPVWKRRKLRVRWVKHLDGEPAGPPTEDLIVPPGHHTSSSVMYADKRALWPARVSVVQRSDTAYEIRTRTYSVLGVADLGPGRLEAALNQPFDESKLTSGGLLPLQDGHVYWIKYRQEQKDKSFKTGRMLLEFSLTGEIYNKP